MANQKKNSWVGKVVDFIFGDKQINSDALTSVKSKASITGSGTYRFLGSVSFNGEKNHGEMGPIKDYVLDYDALRYRSWQLYLESEIAQTVLGKFNTWVIGKGLKLQAEPVSEILESSGIRFDGNGFSQAFEKRFNLFSGSRMADYSNMRTLNAIEAEAFKNAQIGGDCLVVLRYKKGKITVQLIDGANVVNPMFAGSYEFTLNNGNRIVHGVEINDRGEHVAYHVRKTDPRGQITFETERIPARGTRSGLIMAYMYYGHRYRIDSVRGMPALAVVMETAKKLERYKEATVGSAEERQKIPYFFEHKEYGTGENPLLSQMAKASNIDSVGDDMPVDDVGNAMADKVAATTNKQVFNLPLGATVKSMEGKTELYFKDFYEVNIKLFCAAVQIPVDVALSSYNNSFSASRAALKDWENTLNVRRSLHGEEFRKPIVDLFLHAAILDNEISAPGYIQAFQEDNQMVLEAYRKCRFVGAPVPHIDPVKEVNAERLKLGATGANIPLTTVESATESLNGGDSVSNMEKYAQELDKANSLKIQVPPPPLDPNKQQQRPANKKEA